VPADIESTYKEACLILQDSPKASAALSRRCLQAILEGAGGVRPGSLFDEIQQLLDKKELPTLLLKSLDYVRVVGNFAAHPEKSTTTGEIVEVEPQEAEWNLSVLEMLFDEFYVKPATFQTKLNDLATKLNSIGGKTSLRQP
jgi:hypothetical protein